jgi:Fe2+ transport system protein FeoA/bacterioferritin-associated ferredoxin
MNPDDHVCLCFRVSQRKLVNFMERERPRVASQLSECLGAGTGCQWCVPFLRKLHAQWERGEVPQLTVAPAEYAARRSQYRSSGIRPDPAPSEIDASAPSDVAVETESQYHSGRESMPGRTDPSQPVRVPLTQLRRGQRAIVDCSELTDLPEGDRCLLHAMGMHHECEVRVCRPGTPCIVQIDNTRLGISGDVARKIFVTPIDDSPGSAGAPETRA